MTQAPNVTQPPDPGFPPTVPELLQRAVAQSGQSEFIVTGDLRLTFAQVDEMSRSLAARLVAVGVGKGSHVGILVGNRPEWVVTFLAVVRIGALAIPISTFYKAAEVAAAVRHTDVQVLLAAPSIAGRSTAPLLEEAFPSLPLRGTPLFEPDVPALRTVYFTDAPTASWGESLLSLTPTPEAVEVARGLEGAVAPADLLAVIPSSGTSGAQKAVMHTHGGLVRHAYNIASFDSLPRGRRTFTSAPFFWVGGLVPGILVHMYLGGTLLVLDRLDPDEAFDFIERERPDALFGFSLLERIARASRFADSDTSWLPGVPVAHQGARADGSRHNSLGMSETGGVHSAPGPEAGRILPDHLRGAFGRALPGIEHRIVVPGTQTDVAEGQEGEICVRGYSLMHGLYKSERSETFDSDGWYHTRDLGLLREGYLFFTGRADDQIRTKGANISPAEVEAALIATGEVVRACVVGVPDEASGQLVGAYVVPEQPEAFDTTRFLATVASRISSYKVPRRLFVAPEIPVLSSGKIDRRRILADLMASAAAPVRHQAEEER